MVLKLIFDEYLSYYYKNSFFRSLQLYAEKREKFINII